ncbi:MAG: TlpA family protein disulfide reductase [Thermodesulfobacteriota bacterium]
MRLFYQFIPSRYWLIYGLLALLPAIALVACSGTESGSAAGGKAEPLNSIGGKAADFTIKTFTGEGFTLSAHAGSPVLINFWASWCPPCRMEGPALERLYKKFGPKGVVFIGVAVQDSEKGSLEYLEDMGWTFPAGPDNDDRLARLYNVQGIPKTLILQGDHTVTYIQSGVRPEEYIAKKIEEVLLH